MNGAQLEPSVRHLRRLVEAQATKELSDAQLLEQFARRRDEAAFAALMRRHGGLVWRVCRQVLHQEQDAEDAFQASFLVLALKAASLQRGQGLGNWLHGVAYRVAMNARRKTLRRQAHERRKAAATPRTLPAAAALHDLQTLLHEEIDRLPGKYRVTLVLCGLEGKSKSEAARELGWKEGTVSGRLARARKMLEARLARRGVMLSAAWAATTVGVEAGMPSSLVWATTAAALHVAAGQALSAGIVSSQVGALMKGTLKAMSLAKLNLALTLVLGLGLLGTGVGLAAYAAFTNEPTSFSREPPASARDDKPAPQTKQPRVDLYGDPLPKGAIARLGTIRLRQDDVEAMALSPDGRVLITKSVADQSIRAWEPDPGKLLWQTESGGRGGVNNGNGLVGAHFSPDGRFLAEIYDCRPANGMAECIYLCDAKDGKVLHRFPEEGGFWSIWEAVFSPDSKVIAANIKGTIYLWSTATGRQIAKCDGATSADATIRFSSDGKTLLSAFRGKTLSHWNVVKRVTTSIVELKTKEAFGSQTMSEDGRLLAVAAGLTGQVSPFGPPPTSTLQLFDTTTGKECCKFQGDTTGIAALVFSRDGHTLIGVSSGLGNRLSTISVWDTGSGKLRHRFPLPLPSSYHLGVTPDGRKLFTSISSNHGWLAHGPGESVVRWWDVTTGKELMTKPAHEDRVESVCFTPDGRFLLSAANDNTMRVWDIASGRSLRRVEGHYARALSVVSSQGTFLANGEDGKLSLYNWVTGRGLQRFPPPPEPANVPDIMKARNHVSAFVVSADGRGATSLRACSRGLTGDAEYFFDFWDLPSGKIRKSSTMPRGIRFSHFQPDGKRFVGFLFSGNWDSADAVVVDIETGRIETVLQHADRKWMKTATAADGRTLVTATTHAWQWNSGGHIAIGPHTIHVWELSSAKECMTITSQDSGPDDRWNHIAIAPDCRTIVAVSHGSVLHFWDMLTGEELLQRTGAPARVTSLGFSPDGKSLATGHGDSTILVWDLSSIGAHYKSLRTKAEARQVAAWWEDLASRDARKAHQAVGHLIAAADSATALLRMKLAAAPPAERPVSGLIADLDHKSFVRRKKAFTELEKLLPQARPALVNALAKTSSLEARRRIESLLALSAPAVRDPQVLGEIRGVQVLEHIAAAGADATRLAALDFLKKLAAGAPAARLTQEAKASLDRLAKRPALVP